MRKACVQFFLPFFVCTLGISSSYAEVTALSIQSPSLPNKGITNLISPVHLQATAEDTLTVTGYAVYVDGQNVYRNFRPSMDAWITLPAGNHTLFVKAWDSQTNFSTPTYNINITGFAPPTPPNRAHHILNIDQSSWTVDNNPDVGGDCNHGSIGSFGNASDPNTRNVPTLNGNGQHFILKSGCAYDDSLFYRKFGEGSSKYSADTNYLWDFWFYIPSSSKSSTIQALEFDLFHTVPLADGVHEFMFGSQCNYISDQWQFWLPQQGTLTWVDAGISPCRFSTGAWHHATYFLQRVTPRGYQEIPKTFNQSTDTNNSLRFGTLTIDGQTVYLGGVSWSTIPNPAWATVLGVQHQLDSAAAGIVIEEYADGESLVTW